MDNIKKNKKKVRLFLRIILIFLLSYFIIFMFFGISGSISNKDNLLRVKAQRISNYITYKLFVYYNDNNCFPGSIDELIEKKYLYNYKMDPNLEQITIKYSLTNSDNFELTSKSNGMLYDFETSQNNKYDQYLHFMVHMGQKKKILDKIDYIYFDSYQKNSLECYVVLLYSQEKTEIEEILKQIKSEFNKKFKAIRVNFFVIKKRDGSLFSVCKKG